MEETEVKSTKEKYIVRYKLDDYSTVIYAHSPDEAAEAFASFECDNDYESCSDYEDGVELIVSDRNGQEKSFNVSLEYVSIFHVSEV